MLGLTNNSKGLHQMNDPGMILANNCFDQMGISSEWSIQNSRGWSWWGHRLRQNIKVDQPQIHQGKPTSVVRVSTQLLAGMLIDLEAIQRELCELNRNSVLTSYSWDGFGSSIYSTAVFIVHPENLLLDKLVSHTMQQQLAHAELLVDDLGQKLNADIAKSPHPDNGFRPYPDSILNSARNGMQSIDPIDLEDLAADLGIHFIALDLPIKEIAWTKSGEPTLTTQVEKFTYNISMVNSHNITYGDTELEAGPGLLIEATGAYDMNPHAVPILNDLDHTEEPNTHLLGGWWTQDTTPRLTQFVPFMPLYEATEGDQKSLASLSIELIVSTIRRTTKAFAKPNQAPVC